MGKINNMIKTIKEIHKEDIVMIKIGIEALQTASKI